MCATCEKGLTALNGLCVQCPSIAGQALYVIGDVLVWTLVALSAWFCKVTENYQRVVEFVVMLQSIGQFGTLLSATLPRSALWVFDALKIFMGDYSVHRPECI